MANVAANVLVGKPAVTGGILIGDLGVTLPTDATSSLAGGLVGAGYVSEDGLTQTVSADTTEIKAWSGDTVRTIQTSHSVTFQVTLIETNDVSLEAYYGDAYSAGTVQLQAGDLPRKVWVFEMADDGSKIRIVVPNGEVTDRADVVYKNDTPIGGQVTVTAYPDSAGVKAYIYTDGVPADEDDTPVAGNSSPATTPAAGGALVTITGNGFMGATNVKFGATNATNFVVVNDNKIVATAPAHASGTANITVINTTGTSNALSFSYT